MNTEPEELFNSVPEGEPVDDAPECEGSFEEEDDDHEYDYDGQPDWAQEWHDFDPDC